MATTAIPTQMNIVRRWTIFRRPKDSTSMWQMVASTTGTMRECQDVMADFDNRGSNQWYEYTATADGERPQEGFRYMDRMMRPIGF
jgi:hypothetical protein